MDAKDQKIQDMERQLVEMQQEVDSLKHGGRKKRKVWKTVLIVAGVIVALIAAVLIVVFTMAASDKESPAMAEQIIQAVVDKDADTVYAMFYPGVLDREDFDQGFGELCQAWQLLGGGDAFELERTYWGVNTNGGTTQYTTQYRVTSGEARFMFELIRMVKGDQAGVVSAKMTEILSD